MSVSISGTNLYKFSHISKEEVLGGQGTSSSFKPNLSLGCFLGKGRLTLLPQLSGTFSPQPSGESLLIDHNVFAIRMTPTLVLPGFNEFGGMDFVITLKKKPPSNKIALGYDATNLVAYHQAVLTAQEITEGAFRPDHVVNSIAFYHATKGGIILPGDVDSRITTGKALHLYRLKATAADGSWIWANWELGAGNTIILSVDQAFLNTKPYPIILAPVGDTFGYTTAGGTSFSPGLAIGHAGTVLTYVASAGDTITSFTWYGTNTGSDARLAAYTQTSGLPDARLAASVQGGSDQTSLGWHTSDTVSQALAGGTRYGVAFGDYGSLTYIYYDSGTGTNWSNHNGPTTLPATWSNLSTFAARASWYATYTAGGAAATGAKGVTSIGSGNSHFGSGGEAGYIFIGFPR